MFQSEIHFIIKGMKTNFKNHSQKGFSLVEVMVAVGLTAVLGYVLMQQSDMSKKQQMKASFNNLVSTQAAAIQKELTKSENCTASFRDLKFGTQNNPTVITDIRRGIADMTQTPPVINPGQSIFKINQAGASGIYIESMHLIQRPGDNKDVLRVTFVSGDVVGTQVRERERGYGASKIPKDFFIMTQKRDDQTIASCYSESVNHLATACLTLPGGVWDGTTQKCTITGIVKRSDLVQLWRTKDGTLAITRPADVENGEVTCQKSSKRCSRTNMDCTLPACPPNHYYGRIWEWDRKQSMWDKACMKSGKCMYSSQPGGWMVKQ